MKRIFTALSAVAFGATLALPLMAQDTPANQRPQYGPNDRPMPLPHPQDVVEGEAYFLERIAIPPDSKLFVSLVGRVAGAEYLPLASTIVPARNGITPFRLLVPQGLAPAGPYRLQAWIVADNRLWMNGANPQTTLNSLSDKARIRLKMAPAPRNIDGIGDGKPLPDGVGNVMEEDTQTQIDMVRGTIVKRDRRALLPDAQIEVTVSDISLADAPAKVVGRQTFSSDGKQVPISFAVPLNANDIEAKRRYNLSVRISEGGKLSYISDTIIPVTPENWKSEFQVNVIPVGG
ncbi:putative lipoprotein YbaY [Abditibacteriota bacterium]|nr:putative lipoprotein YbaY [Abditibacteriota bacterium]